MFQLTPKGIEEPGRELARTLQERGVAAEQCRAVEVGESLRLANPGEARCHGDGIP
jgi:hypothetical protein